MQRYEATIMNQAGEPVSSAGVLVYLAGTQNLASLFSDYGQTPIANPRSSDINGRVMFYIADGIYDITVSGGGITTYTIQRILVGMALVAGANVNITDNGNGYKIISATGGGGGGGGFSISDEVVGGSGTTWTLAQAPDPVESVLLVQQLPSFGAVVLIADTDYTISGQTITTTNSITAGTLRAWYSTVGGGGGGGGGGTGIASSVQVTNWANLPSPPTNGDCCYCTDADKPTLPGQTATSQSDKSGAILFYVRGGWIAF